MTVSMKTPMKMSMRWYGPTDLVPLRHIRQVPGVTGVVGALYDVPMGEVWPLAKLVALRDEIAAAGLERELWQAFAVLPVVRSVGVMGDERTYAYPIIIRAVTSEDAMTADWARLPYDVLERISTRIINEVKGVNRVALDITSKPPGTIEWE